MPIDELKANVAPHQYIHLVTVAQAFHWFDRPTFYQHMKLLLKRPNGVLAVWCYTLPRVKDSIDAILERVYAEADPFWAPLRKMVDDEYRTFEFPFEAVEGTENTGPFEFEAKQSMNLDEYLTYSRSWSAYQTARQKGFELLREEVTEEFRRAWRGEDEKHNGGEISSLSEDWEGREMNHVPPSFTQPPNALHHIVSIKTLYLSKLMIEISLYSLFSINSLYNQRADRI